VDTIKQQFSGVNDAWDEMMLAQAELSMERHVSAKEYKGELREAMSVSNGADLINCITSLELYGTCFCFWLPLCSCAGLLLRFMIVIAGGHAPRRSQPGSQHGHAGGRAGS
jgi:hypothetical protein